MTHDMSATPSAVAGLEFLAQDELDLLMLDSGELSALEGPASASGGSESLWADCDAESLSPESLGPESPASSTAMAVASPIGQLDGLKAASAGLSDLEAAFLEPQMLGELVELVTEESAEEKKARRRVQDAIHARQKRSRKKNEMMTLRKQVSALDGHLAGLRSRHKLLRRSGAEAEWEERAMAQRHKRRQAEQLNEQLKRAFVMQRGFLLDLKTVFAHSPLLTPELNMRSLLHTYIHLGRSPRARARDFEAMCTASKLDLAMEILARETRAVPLDTPNITVHKIDTHANEFGMTTVSVYALDTIDISKIFVAACSAILSCETDWPNYTLTSTSAKVVDSPAANIRYGVSDTRYKSDVTGEEILLEGRAVSYYRLTNKYAVLLWDFVDVDDLHPLKQETHMKRDVVGAVLMRPEVCDDGVERIVCRKICTKIHSMGKPSLSQGVRHFSQQRMLSAQAHGCWVYKQINGSVSHQISA